MGVHSKRRKHLLNSKVAPTKEEITDGIQMVSSVNDKAMSAAGSHLKINFIVNFEYFGARQGAFSKTGWRPVSWKQRSIAPKEEEYIRWTIEIKN